MKQNFKFLILLMFGILLVNTLIIAQEPPKEIDYYLNTETNIDEFNNLPIKEQSTILKSASPEKKVILLNKITQDILKKKQLSASGFIAESQGEVTEAGKKNAKYPEKLTWKGFESSNLGFYGTKGKVIGDGKTFLPLDRIPADTTEIEYVESQNKFILRDKNNNIIELSAGAINEEGDIKFLADKNGHIGEVLISKNLNDFNFKGKVEITNTGFKILDEKSKIEYGEVTFLKKPNSKGPTTIDFNEDRKSVSLTNADIIVRGKKFGQRNEGNWDFIFSSDALSSVKKDYPAQVKIADVEKVIETRGVAAMGMQPYVLGEEEVMVTKQRGEVIVFPDDFGNIDKFIKVIEGKRQTLNLGDSDHYNPDGSKNPVIKTMAELKNHPVYKTSSAVMRENIESMFENTDSRNMQALQNKIFPDNALVAANPKLYKEFQTSLDIRDSKPFIAMSTRSDGKEDVIVSPGRIGFNARFTEDIGTLNFYEGTEGFYMDVNPTSNTGLDFKITKEGISKLGPIGQFEIGIDEIRLSNLKGNLGSEVKAIKKAANGQFELVAGEWTTVFSGRFNPIADALVLNNGEATLTDLGLPVEMYAEALAATIESLEKSGEDVTKAVEFLKRINKQYSEPGLLGLRRSTEERAQFIKDIDAKLKEFKAQPLISDQLKSLMSQQVQVMTTKFLKDNPDFEANLKAKFPEGVPLYLREPNRADKTIGTAGDILGQFREAALKDVTNLRQQSPVIGDIRFVSKTPPVTSTLNYPGWLTDEFMDNEFELIVGMKLPEFEALNTATKAGALSPLVKNKIDATIQGAKKMQEEFFASAIAQNFLQERLGQSFSIKSTVEIEVLGRKVSETSPDYLKNRRIKQGYVDDLTNAISQTLGSISLQGESRIKIINNPVKKDVKLVMETVQGAQIPIELKPETRQFIRDGIALVIRAPSQLKGQSRYLPGINLRQMPRVPNEFIRTYYNSRGYKEGPIKTEERYKFQEFFEGYTESAKK